MLITVSTTNVEGGTRRPSCGDSAVALTSTPPFYANTKGSNKRKAPVWECLKSKAKPIQDSPSLGHLFEGKKYSLCFMALKVTYGVP